MAEARTWLRSLTVTAAAALVGAVACDRTPTSPDFRTGLVALSIDCADADGEPLVCRARTYCTGLYRCPDPSADGADVTLGSTWTLEHPGVARQIAPGTFVMVAPGNSVISATFTPTILSSRPVVALLGLGLRPSLEITGSVAELPTGPPTVFPPYLPIRDALVRIVSGPFAGRTATTDVPPLAVPPGFVPGLVGSGRFRILGVPPGTYELRASATGFQPRQATTIKTAQGGGDLSFQLSRE